MSTEAPRCSEFARTIGVLPPGTGLFLTRVVLVSVPLPWPKPALNHPWLRAAATAVVRSAVPSRLFAAEPIGDVAFVEVYERSGARAILHRWELDVGGDMADQIETLAVAVAETPPGEIGATTNVNGVGPTSTAAVPPTFLICTQGSHDSCCGTSGVALADEITHDRPDYAVRRVSHTGGHRFSPTFLAFPEGRMWAYADRDLVDRIVSGSTTRSDHLHHSRGWWGAKVGLAQVAECAVRAERTSEPFIAPLIEAVEASVPEAGQAATTEFLITVGEDSWRVEVHVGRDVPTIACESPGGLPVKPGREFAWSIERA